MAIRMRDKSKPPLDDAELHALCLRLFPDADDNNKDLGQYSKVRELAEVAIAELEQYCSDPESYCLNHDCGLPVLLTTAHPVAVRVNEWHRAAFGEDISEDGRNPISAHWQDITQMTRHVEQVPFARKRMRAFAELLKEANRADLPASSSQESSGSSKVSSDADSVAESSDESMTELQRLHDLAPEHRTPRVQHYGQGNKIVVNDQLKDSLSRTQYDVVRALVVAHPDTLKLKDLRRRSWHGGARNALTDVRKLDSDWVRLLKCQGHFPEGTSSSSRTHFDTTMHALCTSRARRALARLRKRCHVLSHLVRGAGESHLGERQRRASPVLSRRAPLTD